VLFDDSIEVALLTSGAGLLILLLYFPGGLVQVIYSVRDAVLAFVARRRPEPAEAPVEKVAVPAAIRVASKPVPEGVTTAIRTTGVTVRYGGYVAVDGVDLTVGRSEVVGLIGSNGAGKTTLMNAICGVVPSTGDVEIFEKDVRRLSAARRARLGLGRSWQGAELFADLTVRETIGLAVPGVRPWERTVRAEVDEIIAFLGLGRFADKFINELSTGTRRIVELACLMASGARVLCLDEPTAGIAQRETESFGPLVLRIREEMDASMLVIEHDMPLVLGISDRVYCLEAGRIIAEGSPQEVRSNPLVVASYLGTDAVAINRSDATVG
jgi:ABC-type branched-subunit amino acid transport system ATPase component